MSVQPLPSRISKSAKSSRKARQRGGDKDNSTSSSNIIAKSTSSDRGFSERLLAWYQCHARSLPWRIPPSTTTPPDPYRVWMAEIMLQQTTVASVIQYYQYFQNRWPDVEKLAAANDADVMAAWAGLGYYARARNMLACAREIIRDHRGCFPDTEAELRCLSGIGDYSAAAIAAIAFDRRACVIDVNITRVIARCRAMSTIPTRATIRTALEPLLPEHRHGDFAQAMMDLGASLCTPQKPQCNLCPIATYCDAHKQGIAAELPIKAMKKAKPMRYGTALWISRADKIWLVRRPAHGLLGGMRALPDDDWDKDSDAPDALYVVRHSFTHFHLRLSLVRRAAPPPALQQKQRNTPQTNQWWARDAIDTAGLPTLYRKAVAAMDKLESGLDPG